jgi:hypothetical protein
MSGVPWRIITGSVLDDWVYWRLLLQSLLQSIKTAHNQSTAEDSFHSRSPVSILLQLLNSTTELTGRCHVSSLYNFGRNRIEITTSNGSSVIMCLSVAEKIYLESRCLAMDICDASLTAQFQRSGFMSQYVYHVNWAHLNWEINIFLPSVIPILQPLRLLR